MVMWHRYSGTAADDGFGRNANTVLLLVQDRYIFYLQHLQSV